MERETDINVEIQKYEGLIFKTAQLTAPLVEDDFDDVVAVLRIKVWQALEKWDPARNTRLIARVGFDEARRRSVFAWVKNRQIDLIKKKRRGEVSIEGLTVRETDNGQLETRDRFDLLHDLAASADEVYGHVEAEPPLIPSTLTELELRVVCLLYADYRQSDVARFLEIPKRDVERLVRSIRVKMSDWEPSSSPAIAEDGGCPGTPIAA